MFLKSWVTTLCLLSLAPNLAIAEIVFTEAEAKRLVVEIQEGRQAIVEREIMKEEIMAYQEIIKAKDDALKEYSNLLKESQEACEELLSSGGSPIWYGIGGFVGGVGVALLIAVALL